MTGLRPIGVPVLCVVLLAACRQPTGGTATRELTVLKDTYAKCETVEREGTQCSPGLIELIARPEWYDGANVVVAGVLYHDIESLMLFTTEDARRMGLLRSGVHVRMRPGIPRIDVDGLNGKWVYVRGKYVGTRRGALRYGGEIVDVTDVNVMAPVLDQSLQTRVP
jgi:hypothetical protein